MSKSWLSSDGGEVARLYAREERKKNSSAVLKRCLCALVSLMTD